jgi:ABC-type hemin transport system substrate-binding protein
MDRNQQPDGPKDSIEAQLAAFRGLSSTPAARDKRVYEVDGAALLQFGPRTAEAILSLLKLLHPEIEAAKSGN